MTPFKISTSGDYVQLIYVDSISESVQQELRSDTDAFECSYDSDGKLFMQFGAMRFENPDPTDFTIEGSQVTDAADFITKLNALFTGGGVGGNTIYTGDGSLSGDRIIDLSGNLLNIMDGGTNLFHIHPADHQTLISNQQGDNVATVDIEGSIVNPHITYDVTDGTSVSSVSVSAKTGDNVSASFISTNGVNLVSVIASAITGKITLTGVLNLPVHAAADSIADGDIWREDNTNSGLKIRINGVTKTIVVS